MFQYFYRDDHIVRADINSGLKTCKPIYPFGFFCENQEEAELLTRHLNNELDAWKEGIAKDCLSWLEDKEISDLKRRLQKWHGGKHCWI